MSCRDVRDRLAEARLGLLDAAAREGIDRHLGDCEACRAEAEAIDASIDALRRHEDRERERVVPPTDVGAVLRATHESRGVSDSTWSRIPYRAGRLLAGAAVLLLCGIGVASLAGMEVDAGAGRVHVSFALPGGAVDRGGRADAERLASTADAPLPTADGPIPTRVGRAPGGTFAALPDGRVLVDPVLLEALLLDAVHAAVEPAVAELGAWVASSHLRQAEELGVWTAWLDERRRREAAVFASAIAETRSDLWRTQEYVIDAVGGEPVPRTER